MPDTATDLRKAAQEEYGTYVAVEPIEIGNARAFNVGDPVPKSHVVAGLVAAEQVAKVSTKDGAAARSEAASGSAG